jgi:hypothetical protein
MRHKFPVIQLLGEENVDQAQRQRAVGPRPDTDPVSTGGLRCFTAAVIDDDDVCSTPASAHQAR